MSEWLSGNFIEILGVLLSVLYLYLSIRQNILLWPVGFLSAVLYVIVFYQSKFYADMGLNGYYIFISIYGWVTWSKAGTSGKNQLPVVSVGLRRLSILLVIIASLFLILGFLLERYTDSPVPYWDALTTAGSVVATWMLARKMLEHWLIWIVVDLISMGLYVQRGLYPTTALFAIYTTMAVLGYLQWKKSLNK